ncbi:TPR domain-containing protein [Cyclospora cayetanensis]|uniref:TPR domain-containing protein n=1 Tax=Cyclospora cayetanensis TaxID=88456 RepID=A0A1D3D015_9EIME|nr:TPR domain-containing protein [Cyclospora cayetanensis]
MARSAAIPPRGLRSATHRLRDWSVLANAAARAGNIEAAAAAHYSLGLLLEGNKMFGKALLHYTEFLKMATILDSHELQALAHNAKGVVFAALDMLNDAVQEHLLQLKLSDEAGQLVAHMNLGILLHRMGKTLYLPLSPLALKQRASRRYQSLIDRAVRLAAAVGAGKDEEARRHLSTAADLGVELNDPLSYSLALGNLSICSEPSGDYEMSKRLLEEHLVRVQREISRLAAHRPPAVPLGDARAVLQQDTKERRQHKLRLHLQQQPGSGGLPCASAGAGSALQEREGDRRSNGSTSTAPPDACTAAAEGGMMLAGGCCQANAAACFPLQDPKRCSEQKARRAALKLGKSANESRHTLETKGNSCKSRVETPCAGGKRLGHPGAAAASGSSC